MLISLALVLGLCPSAVAPAAPARYPIDPVGLRTLVRSAQLVVVAEVEQTRRIPEPDQQFWGTDVAELRVLRSLKGPASHDDAISVVFASGMLCPSPAHYPVGETVLAFLSQDEDDLTGVYRTVALSYGSKSLAPADLAVYVTRIRELLALEEGSKSPARQAGLNEWITEVMAHPATRYEGLIDLWRKPEFVRMLGEHPLRIEALDAGQVGRLLDALQADSSGDYRWGRFLGVLAKVEDPRLDRILVEKLWAYTGASQSSGRFQAMRRLADRRDDDVLRSFAKGLSDLRKNASATQAEQHQLVTHFLSTYAERHPFVQDR